MTQRPRLDPTHAPVHRRRGCAARRHRHPAPPLGAGGNDQSRHAGRGDDRGIRRRRKEPRHQDRRQGGEDRGRMAGAALAARLRGDAAGGHRAVVHRAVARRARDGHLPLRLLRHGALLVRHQVRFRHRLAELLAADRQGERPRDRRTRASACCGPPIPAPAARRISATSSTTARSRPGSATA